MSGDCNYDIMMYNMITLHTPNLAGKAHIIQKTVIIEGFLSLKYFHYISNIFTRPDRPQVLFVWQQPQPLPFAWCYKVYLFWLIISDHWAGLVHCPLSSLNMRMIKVDDWEWRQQLMVHWPPLNSIQHSGWGWRPIVYSIMRGKAF